jgi:hypothetical protein
VGPDGAPVSTLAPGFSGNNFEMVGLSVEYYDPNLRKMAAAQQPGWERFPGGTETNAFNWQTGTENAAWMAEFDNDGVNGTYSLLQTAQSQSSGKGGTWLSDFVGFAGAVGTKGIVDLNAITDSPASILAEAQAFAGAADAGLTQVVEFELTNEPYIYTTANMTKKSGFYDGGYDYAAKSEPFYEAILDSGYPSPTVGVFYQGAYGSCWNKADPCDGGWATVIFDQQLEQYAASQGQYWNAISTHIYPLNGNDLVCDPTVPDGGDAFMAQATGVVVHGSNDYLQSYFGALPAASQTPLYVTEFNIMNQGIPCQSTLYAGLADAEFTVRASTVPQVAYFGVHSLYSGSSSYSGEISAVDDYSNHVGDAYADGGSINTADAGFNFGMYQTAPGAVLQLVHQEINGGATVLSTSVTGGAVVPISNFDGQPVAAVYAQAYLLPSGQHVVLAFNKSGAPQIAQLQTPAAPPTSVTVTSVCNSAGGSCLADANPMAQNACNQARACATSANCAPICPASQLSAEVTSTAPVSEPPGQITLPAYSLTAMTW